MFKNIYFQTQQAVKFNQAKWNNLLFHNYVFFL